MRDRLRAAAAAVPLVLVLGAAARLGADLAHPLRLAIDLGELACPRAPLSPGDRCTATLPPRDGAARPGALRLPIEGPDPRSAWQVCIGAECRDVAPRSRWGRLELPLPPATPGARAELRLVRAEGGLFRLRPGAKVHYSWPGWGAVLARARTFADAAAPALFGPALAALVAALAAVSALALRAWWRGYSG